MATKQVTLITIKKGDYIILEGEVCRVTNVQLSVPSRHAKTRLEAVGIIDDKKRILVAPAHDNIEIPIIEKKTAQVLSVQENIASVMNTETYETLELKIPEELKDKVSEGKYIMYREVMGNKIMKQMKE